MRDTPLWQTGESRSANVATGYIELAAKENGIRGD